MARALTLSRALLFRVVVWTCLFDLLGLVQSDPAYFRRNQFGAESVHPMICILSRSWEYMETCLKGPIQNDSRKKTYIFILSFLFRLFNAFAVTTFFQPDEYFQAWEPAYIDVYGVGFRSWEWQAAIRTSLVPRCYALIIRAAQYLNVNHLVLGRIFMAIIAALADLYTALLSERLLKGESTLQAWLISLGSMFNWYCSTRPFSNTLEMVLVTVALYYSLSKNTAPWLFSQIMAHVTVALRPSNAILWIYMGLYRLSKARNMNVFIKMVLMGAAVGGLTQLAIFVIDVRYYGQVVIPYIEFVRHNFGSRVSEIYGVLPWHWYLSQAVPFLLLGYLPIAGLGLNRVPALIGQIIVLNISVFSLIAHKEFRFIYFLLPLLHIIVALGWKRSPKLLKITAVIVNVFVAVYLGSVHQRGVVAVVDHIRQNAAIQDVSFLMPCHSTPWHSHFQRPWDASFQPQFLTCDPPWNVSGVNYVDEADRFYLNATQFLEENPSKLASTVVVFEPLQALMSELGYTTQTSFFNGYFNEDSRRQGRVLVMSKRQQT